MEYYGKLRYHITNEVKHFTATGCSKFFANLGFKGDA